MWVAPPTFVCSDGRERAEKWESGGSRAHAPDSVGSQFELQEYHACICMWTFIKNVHLQTAEGFSCNLIIQSLE